MAKEISSDQFLLILTTTYYYWMFLNNYLILSSFDQFWRGVALAIPYNNDGAQKISDV